MSERSSRRREAADERARRRSQEALSHGEEDAERFTGDGPGERGYRGNEVEGLPHGRVAGGSYGGGGGYSAGGLSSGDEASAGFDAYGLGSNRRSSHELERSARRQARGGYAEQGFGAGEGRGHNWGGGPRGGYGGGNPGGPAGGTGWDASGERYELGRGPRSRETWAGDAPWRQSEFAGRGEFGSAGWNDTRSVRDHWNIPGPHTGRGPQGYSRSETAIREDICDRLTRHGELDASRVTVSVENGEVTLEGYVESRAAKRMAEDTAESVAGVRDVHNRLRIVDGG